MLTTKNRTTLMWIGLAVVLATATLLWMLRGPFHQPPARVGGPPNIILITLDTVRADHLSCYGYLRKTTPNIDAMAQESLVYTRCLSTSSWTLPTHASLLTGRFPSSHGATYDPKGPIVLSGVLPGEWSGYRVNALSADVESIATILKRQGYVTGAAVGGPWLKKPFGLNQGFDTYDDDQITDVNGRLGEQINERALPWIDKNAGRPFFLFLNYFDPHDPYIPPEKFRFQFLDKSKMVNGAKATPYELVAFYDAEIYYADYCVGRLIDRLKRLGLYDNTWIIITADHGELFGEHGMRGHGVTLYEEELHVPMIVKFPKPWATQGRSSSPIQLIDVMPMILSRLNLPAPPTLQGTVPDQARHPIFAEVNPLEAISDRGDFRAFYEGDFKYVWNSRGRHQLYNLGADPKEDKNLYAAQTEKAMAMREAVDLLLNRLPRPGQSATTRTVDQETLDALRGLGYIPGASKTSRPSTTQATSRPSQR